MVPKISINKLGEYLSATASRRRRIIKDQKSPSTFKAARYTDARKGIVDFMESEMENECEYVDKMHSLVDQSHRSVFDEQDKTLSATSMENFLEVCDEIDIDFTKYKLEASDQFSQYYSDISGVRVSMRPDVIIKKRESEETVGALKLHFSKSSPLGDDGCKYVAAAIKHHLEDTLSNSKVENDKCIVVDIPSKNIQSAPKAFKKRLKDISAACEEINDRWDHI